LDGWTLAVKEYIEKTCIEVAIVVVPCDRIIKVETITEDIREITEAIVEEHVVKTIMAVEIEKSRRTRISGCISYLSLWTEFETDDELPVVSGEGDGTSSLFLL